MSNSPEQRPAIRNPLRIRGHACVLACCFAWITAPATIAQQTDATVITAFVSDMHCQHCAKKIRSQLYTLKGVLKVTTDLEKGIASIVPMRGVSIPSPAIWEKIEKARFTPTKIVGPQGTYQKQKSG